MKLRIARHTTDLKAIIDFYSNLLGLKVLGEFKDHDNYDGVFLGRTGLKWELEFTVSNDLPFHKSDEDDLLVFYLESKTEYENTKEKLRLNNISEVEPKNPYWKENGNMYLDPDGFRIVISIPKSNY